MGWNPETDFAATANHPFAKVYEAADTDIRPFVSRGGKLLLWHGGYDPGPSPLGTIAYYDAASRKLGPRAAGSVRLFLAPGVYHCGGGPGPDQFDLLGALDEWVEKGAAPQSVTATKTGAPISRPLCPYPQQARYRGGDMMAAASFQCRR